jgi:hypothetical protein
MSELTFRHLPRKSTQDNKDYTPFGSIGLVRERATMRAAQAWSSRMGKRSARGVASPLIADATGQ